MTSLREGSEQVQFIPQCLPTCASRPSLFSPEAALVRGITVSAELAEDMAGLSRKLGRAGAQSSWAVKEQGLRESQGSTDLFQNLQLESAAQSEPV